MNLNGKWVRAVVWIVIIAMVVTSFGFLAIM